MLSAALSLMASLWHIVAVFTTLLCSISWAHEGELHDYIGGSSTVATFVTTILSSQKRIPNKYVLSNTKGKTFWDSTKVHCISLLFAKMLLESSIGGIEGLREYSFTIGVTSIPWTAAQEFTFSKLTVPQARTFCCALYCLLLRCA